MVTLSPTKRSRVILIPPTHSFLFEQAEHLLDGLMPWREPDWKNAVPKVIASEQASAGYTSMHTMDRALQLKALKKRVRAAMLIHSDLVAAMDRLSVRPHPASH